MFLRFTDLLTSNWIDPIMFFGWNLEQTDPQDYLHFSNQMQKLNERVLVQSAMQRSYSSHFSSMVPT